MGTRLLSLARPPDGGQDGLSRAATRAFQVLLVAAVAVGALWLFARLRIVFVPAVLALMLAAASWPLVSWLRRHRVPASLAAALTMVLGLSIVGGLSTLVVWGIAEEWPQLRAEAEEGLRELDRAIASGALPIDPTQVERAEQGIRDALAGGGAGARLAGGAVVAGEVVAGTLLTVVMLFFILRDGPKLWAFALRFVPEHAHSRAERIGTRCLNVLGAYVRGTTVIAFVDAVIIGLTLAILGVPMALPLAVLVFLTAYVPLAGAIVSGAMASLVALVSNGVGPALIVLAVVIAVNQLEGDVLGPIVYGRTMSLHPLAVLLSLTAGTALAGIIGALLAVPAMAVAWTVATAWHPDPDEAEDPVALEVGPDRVLRRA
jgi:predicted PurR-regulated permease PerM